jgi:hypothetical protein
MDARVSGGTRRVGAHGVALHPLLAASQPLEVKQGAANTFQSFHLSGKCSTNNIKRLLRNISNPVFINESHFPNARYKRFRHFYID